MRRRFRALRNQRPRAWALLLLLHASLVCCAQDKVVELNKPEHKQSFPIADHGRVAALYIAPENPEAVRTAASAFADDVERVVGTRPRILTSLQGPLPPELVAIGVADRTPAFQELKKRNLLSTGEIDGKWEAAKTVTIGYPPSDLFPGTKKMLAIVGSDRRGVAYALFAISRAMGVSPWYWWADVPIARHRSVYVAPGAHLRAPPSVQYRGIFLNDEDWGLRPWAARKMDPAIDHGKGNIGPNTYAHVFELLLRLGANSLWPAMHPGSLAFNAVPENANLADQWGIVMGSSHSEALLRNNVGEWSELAPPRGDGPWNYQKNAAAMKAYWEKRLVENGHYENFYTVGLRGLHDSGLEATGSVDVKARLVEQVMEDQRKLLAAEVSPDLAKIPQVIWLYKESLDLYRAGMTIPDDVTLGWTDDNYGYLRQLPTDAEQKRAGGSGIYYHISYWGAPHDYLWLCTTPPSLIQEEMTKAYDRNARRYWIVNVGDLKPAEADIDFFMQLAANEPKMAKVSQRDFLEQWLKEQVPSADAKTLAEIMRQYYALNFIRKPEFMGFNGYDDAVRRTDFNPFAWPTAGEPNQNRGRMASWRTLRDEARSVPSSLPEKERAAYFELVGYPVEAAADMNEKFLATDRTYIDAFEHRFGDISADARHAKAAYEDIQKLTLQYNSLLGGKWDGIMSAAPRERQVFTMPPTATEADAEQPLPKSWQPDDDPQPRIRRQGEAGFTEKSHTVSIAASHFARRWNGAGGHWHTLADLGISGDSLKFDGPSSVLASKKDGFLEYDFAVHENGPAILAVYLLPTFPLDADHQLRYAVQLDDGPILERDMRMQDKEAKNNGDGPNGTAWAENVLRNLAIDRIPLSVGTAGSHRIRLIHRDSEVVFEHLVLGFPKAAPAYPVPPETR